MATIAGKTVPPVDIVVTLPTHRKDGSTLPLTEIQSITIVRTAAAGGESKTVIPGPFHAPTVVHADVNPVSGTDIYSFYATDTQGVDGDRSFAKTVIVTGELQKVAPGPGTLSAHAHIGAKAVVIEKPPQEPAEDKPAARPSRR